MTDNYISIIERGVRSPGFKLGKEIADYFGVTIDSMNYFGNDNTANKKEARL